MLGFPDTWGCGYATAAIGMLVYKLQLAKWLRGVGRKQCHALIHPANTESQGAFIKNDFVLQPDLRGRNDQLVYLRDLA